MTSEIDVANRALQAIGTRTTIAGLNENSPEARQCSISIDSLREEILRMAPWNCATSFNNLALICAAHGTPENPTPGPPQWQKGIPPPPWAYEYAYPVDCLRPLWIVPQFTTGFVGGAPIGPTTGGAATFWNGPPVRFKVAIDQIDNADIRVILTNQSGAILSYIKKVNNPDVMDPQFVQAWVAGLAGRLAFALTGDKALANGKLQEANHYIATARQSDANEGLTVNDVTPDWIRTRGIAYPSDYGWSPNTVFDWGGMLTMY